MREERLRVREVGGGSRRWARGRRYRKGWVVGCNFYPKLYSREAKNAKNIDVDKIRTCARRTYLMPIFGKIRVKPLNHSGTTSFIVSTKL